MVTASATGLVRMLLIIVGGFVVLRFLGQLMTAKRNMEEERKMNESQRKFDAAKRKTQANIGKTHILRSSETDSAEDVDFEEL